MPACSSEQDSFDRSDIVADEMCTCCEFGELQKKVKLASVENIEQCIVIRNVD